MDPLTVILTAVVSGAAAAATDLASQAVKDGYAAIKNLIASKFGKQPNVEGALNGVEGNPESEVWQAALKEELAKIKVEQDQQLVQQAQALLDLLNKEGFVSGPSYRATVSGSGAIAQGEGAVAAGERAVAIGGSVQGGVIITGDSNVVGDRDREDER